MSGQTIDDYAIYFQVVPRSHAGALDSPGSQFVGGTLEQARAFATLALSWPGVGTALIEPWTIKGNRQFLSERHDADGAVSHYAGREDGGSGEWTSGPLPSTVLDRLGDTARL
ncbi:hypothetical protein [Streptomyces sp. NPDC040750]|uniref:hypothetical protein n=1 Tax=Streptomyces sp. NPDC040750 TaxID=3154491 RepID=UPI0033F109D1